jgi:hypothetical protein
MNTHELTAEELGELVAYAKALGIMCIDGPLVGRLLFPGSHQGMSKQVPRTGTGPARLAWRAVARWLNTPDGAMWAVQRVGEIVNGIPADWQAEHLDGGYSVRVECAEWCDGPSLGLAFCRAGMAALRDAGKVEVTG